MNKKNIALAALTLMVAGGGFFVFTTGGCACAGMPAVMKANLGSAQEEALAIYDSVKTYESICSNPQISRAIEHVEKVNGDKAAAVCSSTKESFIMHTYIPDDKSYFCVDQDSYITSRTPINSNATSCPSE